MTFMEDIPIKFGLILYLLILLYLLIKRKYNLRQHLLFIVGFAVGLFLIIKFYFPLDIEDYTSMLYQESRMYKHSLIPFQYWLRDIFVDQTLDQISQQYYNSMMPEALQAELRQIFAIEFRMMVWFSLMNCGLAAVLTFSRLWLRMGYRSLHCNLRSIIIFLLILDILYIAKYYWFSLARDGFDTAWLLFQGLGVWLGYILFRWKQSVVNDKSVVKDQDNGKQYDSN